MLKYKQELFISALIRLGSIEAACKEVGINRSTYYRWLQQYSLFVEELREKQCFVYNNSIENIKTFFTKVMDSYENLLDSEDENIKLKTISEIVKNTDKIIEINKRNDKYKEWLEIYNQETWYDKPW